jgi:hypothetical protein
MNARKVILVAIIIVLFAALGLELKYIEETLMGATLPLSEQCERMCSAKGSVPYVVEGACYCKEPVTFNGELRCFSNVSFGNDSYLAAKFNASSVRDLAVRSAVKYLAPNSPSSKVFGIFREVSTKVSYVSDPRKDDYVANPLETWESGGGDCDDFSVLLASMYEAVGLDASIVEAYNTTQGHVFVIVRIEQDYVSFLKAYGTLLEKYTPYFSEKPFNIVAFSETKEGCDALERQFDSGQSPGSFYVAVDSTASPYPGGRDPFEGYDNFRFVKVGE